jgi:signal transduction histidine kinase
LGPAKGLSLGAQALTAFLASVGSFVLSAAILKVAHPHVPVVILGLLYTFAVVVVAHFSGIAYAVPISVASVVALDWYAIPPTHSFAIPNADNLLALLAYLATGVFLGQLAAHARRRAEISEVAVSVLLGEQAALRRVATLVAQGAPPEQVFAGVAREVARVLDVGMVTIDRYEPDASSSTVVASFDDPGFPVGSSWPLDGPSLAATVLATRRPARVDDYGHLRSAAAAVAREHSVSSTVGVPILVDGAVWGVICVGSTDPEPLPSTIEDRLAAFTELLETAISNAQGHAELMASRARIAAAADETRKQIERDLHDGTQQRLVSLGLQLRAARMTVPSELDELDAALARVSDGLESVFHELREISHGIHPALLSEGGLKPALAALGRRSAVPVELEVRAERRLPERIEVAAYYVVSEALTNAAKHAHASVVHIELDTRGATLVLVIRDDGIGGADPDDGSGLLGLSDRIEALGGTLDVTSPGGDGTTLTIEVPLEVESAPVLPTP